MQLSVYSFLTVFCKDDEDDILGRRYFYAYKKSDDRTIIEDSWKKVGLLKAE